MKFLDAGAVKEIIFGVVFAALCFSAPTLVGYMFSEPTLMHEIVNDLPFLGSMILGLACIRLYFRKKSYENEEKE